jgi:nucleoside-diphosphate-sugar epimerase
MNIFITGANGFIGKHLLDDLIKRTSFNIFILLKKNKKNLNLDKIFYSQRVHITYGNYDELDKLKKIVLKCDLICNLGFPNKLKFKNNLKKKDYLMSLRNILCILKEKKKFKLVHISSSEVYGFKKITNKISYSENVQTLPQNAYAKAKLEAETLILRSNLKIIKNTIILRLFNVYGIGQTHKTIINDIISKLSLNKKRIKLKNIYDERDYIFLNDVIDAIRYSLLSKNISGVYNVSSGKTISVKNIFKVIKDIIGKNEIKLLDSRNFKYSSFSSGKNIKIRKKIGWKPRYSSIEAFKENIKKILIYKNK